MCTACACSPQARGAWPARASHPAVALWLRATPRADGRAIACLRVLWRTTDHLPRHRQHHEHTRHSVAHGTAPHLRVAPLRMHAGAPLHLYTPTLVSRYATTSPRRHTPSPLHPYGCTQLPLVYGCAANGTIVTITMAPSEAEVRGAALWWGPEAVAEPCVQETLVTT